MVCRGVVGMIGCVLVVMPAVAAAQPAPRDMCGRSAAGEPLCAVDRGVLLAEAEAELEAGVYVFAVDDLALFDIVDLALAGRFSFGALEVFAGTELVVSQPGPDDADDPTDLDGLQALSGGGRYQAGPGNVLARLAYVGTDGSLAATEVTAGYEGKRRVSDQVALISGAGIRYHLLGARVEGVERSFHAVYLYGGGTAQFQATRSVAIEIGLQLSMPVDSGDDVPGASEPTWSSVFSVSGGAAWTVGSVDLFGHVEAHRERFLYPAQASPASFSGLGPSFKSATFGVRWRP